MKIGIDEAGRGPIAGPVAVGVFCLKDSKIFRKITLPLRDSKKLTKKQRQEWFLLLQKWKKEGLCDFYVSLVSASVIDKKGITHAIQKGIEKGLEKVCVSDKDTILLDGLLKAPKEFKKQKTIVKGDEKEKVISLASIVAKVTRDAYMERLSKKYPLYGFETHAGYGTRFHYEAIKEYGVSPSHRKTFLGLAF